jgi:hypothetical protein
MGRRTITTRCPAVSNGEIATAQTVWYGTDLSLQLDELCTCIKQVELDTAKRHGVRKAPRRAKRAHVHAFRNAFVRGTLTALEEGLDPRHIRVELVYPSHSDTTYALSFCNGNWQHYDTAHGVVPQGLVRVDHSNSQLTELQFEALGSLFWTLRAPELSDRHSVTRHREAHSYLAVTPISGSTWRTHKLDIWFDLYEPPGPRYREGHVQITFSKRNNDTGHYPGYYHDFRTEGDGNRHERAAYLIKMIEHYMPYGSALGIRKLLTELGYQDRTGLTQDDQ